MYAQIYWSATVRNSLELDGGIWAESLLQVFRPQS